MRIGAKMLKSYFEELLRGVQIRQNLSLIRNQMNEQENREEVILFVNEHADFFKELLQEEDAKIRKNVALLLGEVGNSAFLESIFEAYENEQTLFVKSSYLNAMEGFNYEEYLPRLKNHLERLSKEKMNEDNRKHLTAELRELRELIVRKEGVTKHSFTKSKDVYDLILLTNRLHSNSTKQQILESGFEGEVSDFTAGLRVKTNQIAELMKIRTIQEVLFLIPKMHTCQMDPVLAGKKIANSELLTFLMNNHEGEAPFYFRIELKNRMPLNKKSFFVKKLGAEIEKQTGRKLINSTTNYEFEIRLIENKEGSCNVMVKLFTLYDRRFQYRNEVIANSIKPVHAALCIQLAKNYLTNEARVLDPFCGVGTMLLERNYYGKTDTCYGVDVLVDAIEKGRRNTEIAGQTIHFINKDFEQFTHEYLFDEIITNMPFVMGKKTKEDIYQIYRMFFNHVLEVLKKDGIMILYVHDPEYVEQFSKSHKLTIEKNYQVLSKENTWLYILRY